MRRERQVGMARQSTVLLKSEEVRMLGEWAKRKKGFGHWRSTQSTPVILRCICALY